MYKNFSVNLYKLKDHVSIVDLQLGSPSTCRSVWRSWSDHIYRDSVCACSCHSTVMVCSILSQYEREISRLLFIIGEHSMCEKICNVSFVACRIFNRRILFCIALLKAQKNFSNIPYYLCIGHHLLVIGGNRSEEHTSELQSPVPISYAVFCLKKKKITNTQTTLTHTISN